MLSSYLPQALPRLGHRRFEDFGSPQEPQTWLAKAKIAFLTKKKGFAPRRPGNLAIFEKRKNTLAAERLKPPTSPKALPLETF